MIEGLCFIDTMRPVTPAETAAWKAYLGLPQPHWRAARALFRRVHYGTSPAEALLGFTADAGVTDPDTLAALETALRALAGERLNG